MEGYQFIHIETYSRTPSRNGKKQSAFSIAKEAERVLGFCPHVKSPKRYVKLYGVTPQEAVEIAEQRASAGRDSRGRKIRKDGQIILSGVASCPVKSRDFRANDPELRDWISKNHEFLQREWGENYISSILHLDEEYIHIHFMLRLA